MSWLRRHDRPLAEPILERAVESWHKLAAQPDYQDILSTDVLAWIETMVVRMDRPLPVLQGLPATLCHGDCHHGNLLLDDNGAWRWADWQEVGIGRGPEDLSFFLQRARMAGGSVPEDAAVTAYHRSLAAAIAQPISLTAVRQAVAASELRTLLLFWPPFLSQISPEQMVALVRRLHRLAGTAAPTRKGLTVRTGKEAVCPRSTVGGAPFRIHSLPKPSGDLESPGLRLHAAPRSNGQSHSVHQYSPQTSW